jgi:AcrR family transcriptional regulator
MARPRTSSPRVESSAADRLIDAAEALYGQYGLDGVSLRQISVAAGNGNNNAVQYHFGDAAGLIRAITEKRLPELELMRAHRLAKVKEEGRLGDSRALMDILYRPLFEHVNAEGERAYARFNLALISSPSGLKYAIDSFQLMPISDHVLDLLRQANPGLPWPLIRERQRLIALMVLSSLFSRRPPYALPEHDEALIEDALDMATAAVTAPLAPAVAEMMGRLDWSQGAVLGPTATAAAKP